MRRLAGVARMTPMDILPSIRNSILTGLVIAALHVACVSTAEAQASGELHVLASNLGRPAVQDLVPRFESKYRVKIKVEYANNPILKQKIEGGENFDVVLIEPAMLADLAKARFVDSDSIVDLAQAGMALYAKEGSPALDISTVGSFKKALLAARSIAYETDGHSGAVFLSTLERIGIAERMKSILIPVSGRPATVDVLEGKAQYTALPGVGKRPGLRIVGIFPPEVQTYIGVSVGLSPQARSKVSAKRFLNYLRSEPAKNVFRSLGYTIVGSSRFVGPIDKEHTGMSFEPIRDDERYKV